MTPYYADPWLTVYQGDARTVLAELPAESVHCVVTSPPYFGLRDYGTATWEGGDADCAHLVGGQVQDTKWEGAITTGQRPGVDASRCRRCGAVRVDSQLGLEPTPEEYVADLVAVFREVRRVLRDDGTVWLNLGSSYASHDPGGYRHGEHLNPEGREAAKGSGRNRAGTYVAGASGRSRSRQPSRAPAYGSDGTGPRGSQDLGSAYSGLCGECRDALLPHIPRTPPPLLVAASPLTPTGRDTEPAGSEPASPDASPPAFQESTLPRSEPRPLAECSHCGNCGACLAVLDSASRDAQACGRRSAYSAGIESQSAPSEARTSDTVSSGLAWGDYTSTIKPKDMVPIPWMVAMALQADGWYLRSDIIWSKPNSMPESVTDRPTKSHEYLFLLSKSPRYYYDADAVREQAIYEGVTVKASNPDTAKNGQKGKYGATALGFTQHDTTVNGRNLRSVWNIATQPYPGAHFATFPRKLVEPCIKAGCPENGMVLDPFAGSGTTGMVAQSLSRRAVLIDLNADYLVQALNRNRDIPLGLVG